MNSDKVSVQSYVSQRQKLAKFTNQTKLNKFFFDLSLLIYFIYQTGMDV